MHQFKRNPNPATVTYIRDMPFEHATESVNCQTCGLHFAFDEVTFLPRPVQEPRIPLWIGGGYPNRGPTERALRWDGSCLYEEGGTHLQAEP